MTSFQKLKLALTSFSLSVAMSSAATSGGVAKADPLSTHGMVIFGEQTTYASHLPMFHNPHDYQLVMKISLKNLGHSNTLKKYKELVSSGTLFTIAPKPMDLTKVIDGSLTQFPAELYQGHFEKGGTKLGFVTVVVEKIILSSKLAPSAQEQNQYLVFGSNPEYFAVHEINGKPGFDMILEVSQPYELSFGVCKTRVCPDPKLNPVSDILLPLKMTHLQTMEGIKPAMGNSLGDFSGPQAEVSKIIYFEEAELSH